MLVNVRLNVPVSVRELALRTELLRRVPREATLRPGRRPAARELVLLPILSKLRANEKEGSASYGPSVRMIHR